MANGAWFGPRMKELREAAGMTQKQLAEAVGIGIRAVTYYESGERLPDWDVVLTIAEALGVECTAFKEPPAERERPRPGRPSKPKEDVEAEKPKRKPRK